MLWLGRSQRWLSTPSWVKAAGRQHGMTLHPSGLEDGSVHQAPCELGSGAWRAKESSSPDDGRAVVAHQVVRRPASLFVDLGGHRRDAATWILCSQRQISALRDGCRDQSRAGRGRSKGGRAGSGGDSGRGKRALSSERCSGSEGAVSARQT